MTTRNYINNIAPATTATKAIRDDAKRKGTSSLSMREIIRVIAVVRRQSAPRKTKHLAK